VFARYIVVIMENFYFLAGLSLVCGISFWDDISSLPNRLRISVHFLSISPVFYGLGMFSLLPWWMTATAYILFAGTLNACNFMDGVNGMTGLYSLAVLASLQYVNYKLIAFTNPDFINFAILACIVFLFFNFRKRARCFAGDVGSMGISFWICTLLLQLILKTGSPVWILLLSVYGVDTVCTILHRLYLRQNIFQAHRLHFYQILSNERGVSHLKVAGIYAFLQLLVNGVIIHVFINHGQWIWITGTVIVTVLSLIYRTKPKIMQKTAIIRK
jgi:UDP-N-acetylmuramyl pentapeptide phosphotransferase/UDP-N-acetylglucosamine-1-phosphate transferase